MIYTQYDLHFSFDWEVGGTMMGVIDYNEDEMKNVFSHIRKESQSESFENNKLNYNG